MLMRGEAQAFLRMADARPDLQLLLMGQLPKCISSSLKNIYIAFDLAVIVLQIYLKNQGDKQMITAVLIIAVIIKES